ncbi:glycoside hydrolase family 13 protein [Jeotgalibacillus campisalis]|uniref:oligo-1,6-glucosidase n=1 Tax=Jeotgalibacillus campisalis TaxID=220754 RepID=A0A0C2VQ89_9BACL|nr:alpha-glucosidase [Jeotgalibacillus campisalis]KIL51062.1 oligo-1,6-glucosidase [Jeotgalibacillus campisalis]
MDKKWWKESVVYQIYPRSFNDSNGDGIGDIKGIIEKLDYLKNLGIDVIWLSPIYQSPNDDNGYDISDYKAVMNEFGTMEDMDTLVEEIHARGMKLMMDLVVNHSSDEHQWFIESKKSADNPYRDYYIWKKGDNGKPPNNWSSFFSGSTWDYDETTDEYYLHLFSKKQPDLNWENPALRKEIYDMMTWWLDKGVDGFRMDVINLISKVDGLPSTSSGKDLDWGGEYFMNGPLVHEYLQEMNQQVLSKYDIITVGESPGATTKDAARYANAEGTELNMIFTFEHMDLDSGPGGKWDVKPWTLGDLKEVMSKWQYDLAGKGWNSLYLNNHDQPRMVSRFGNDGEYRVRSAKMLATFLHMLQGTPYIYQGEEIGMTNVRFESIEEYDDIEIHNMFREAVTEGGQDYDKVMEAIYVKGRDNARTPMQWDNSDHAGFTTGTPWLKVNPNYDEINAVNALNDQDSIYYFYQHLIQMRKQHDVIVYGKYELIQKDHAQIYAYTRTLDQDELLILCNFSGEKAEFSYEMTSKQDTVELLVQNMETVEDQFLSELTLAPYEARVYKISRS